MHINNHLRRQNINQFAVQECNHAVVIGQSAAAWQAFSKCARFPPGSLSIEQFKFNKVKEGKIRTALERNSAEPLRSSAQLLSGGAVRPRRSRHLPLKEARRGFNFLSSVSSLVGLIRISFGLRPRAKIS